MTSRGFSSVEIAAGVAVVGSLLAVAVPAFIRNVHASHLAEATRGLGDLQAGALAFGQAQHALPPSAPLTPSQVPAGVRAVDPPGAWDHPSWRAVGFRPAPEGVGHAFAFVTDRSSAAPAWTARAHGDLDGDGVISTFEINVTQVGAELKAEPGMIVDRELE